MQSDRERYAEILRSGPLKRVYVDLPEKAHKMLFDLAHKNGIPMKAQMTLLIADAVEKPAICGKLKRKKTLRKKVTRRKQHGKKKANKKV